MNAKRNSVIHTLPRKRVLLMSNAQIDGKVRIFGEAVKGRRIFKISAK
jgi:hypothetical protein